MRKGWGRGVQLLFISLHYNINTNILYCLFNPVYLSVYKSIYISIYLSVTTLRLDPQKSFSSIDLYSSFNIDQPSSQPIPFIYPPTYLSTPLPIYLCTYLPIYPFTYLSIHLPNYLPIYLSIYPPTHLSTPLPIHLSTYLLTLYLFIYSPTYLSTPLPIHLSLLSHQPNPFRYLLIFNLSTYLLSHPGPFIQLPHTTTTYLTTTPLPILLSYLLPYLPTYLSTNLDIYLQLPIYPLDPNSFLFLPNYISTPISTYLLAYLVTYQPIQLDR